MGSTRTHLPRGRRAFSTGMGLTVFASLIGFFIISQIGYMDALIQPVGVLVEIPIPLSSHTNSNGNGTP